MSQQLTFDLPVRAAQGRGDFFVSPSNAAAVQLIDGDWPGGRLVLIGPKGSGKTHLALVWAGDHAGRIIDAADLAGGLTVLLEHAPSAVVVENIDSVAGNADAEEALFHLLNAQSGQGGNVLMTCAVEPAKAGFSLPDLVSRLSGAASAVLDLPDDDLLAALFVKLFSDRQLAVTPDLITYLLARCERSFASIHSIVDQLDALSLAERKPVTRHMAARVLDKSA